MACAAPSYGLITPEKYQAIQQRTVTTLSATPKQLASDKTGMVHMVHAHINAKLKTGHMTRHMRAETEESRHELLAKWIAKVRSEHEEPWTRRARKMSARESDYLWFTGNENQLQFPWFDQETILFKDPQRPSIGLVGADEPDGPSFGPNAPESQDSLPPAPPSTPPSASSPPLGNASAASSVTGPATGPSEPVPFVAPHNEVSTVSSKGKVSIHFECQGREIGISVLAAITEEMIQRSVANEMKMNLDGYWVATVMGGRIGALLDGDRVALHSATAEDIQRPAQPRTVATAEPRKKKEDRRDLRPGTTSTNWLALQREREHFVEWIDFSATLEKDKTIHIIMDGGARPNPGAAGWGALIRQSGRYAQNSGHWDMASNNAMELLAVTEALRIIPDHNGHSVCQEWDHPVGLELVEEWLEKCEWCASGEQITMETFNPCCTTDRC
jgi:hypothetical protein